MVAQLMAAMFARGTMHASNRRPVFRTFRLVRPAPFRNHVLMSGPSGEQYEITFGTQRAVVTEVGAGLREYSVDGHDVVDGYDVDEMSTSGRGQILAPWPNRLDGGKYEFDGRVHQLPLNEPQAGNAIHGLVRWSAWCAVSHEAARVVMEHHLHPQPGYPFAVLLRVDYSLSGDGLTVRTSASNVGREPCPYGMGAHPYLTLGGRVDDLHLRVPATTVLESDERGLPCSAVAVDGTEYDFRHARLVGGSVLDHCFTDLDRDDDGMARVRLAGANRSVTLAIDESYAFVMVFTGDPLPDVARRALAVEPMTCPPNAFATGTAVTVLAPG
jgi:aldose 1-epimerase